MKTSTTGTVVGKVVNTFRASLGIYRT